MLNSKNLSSDYKRRTKLIYKVLAPVVLFVVVLGLIIVIYATTTIKNALIQEEFLNLKGDILGKAPKYLTADIIAKPSEPTSQNAFLNFFNDIADPTTVRLTVWDNNAKVIFSDLRSIIGVRSSSNPDLEKALRGQTISVVRSKDASEPVQTDVGDFLNMFVPLNVSGQQLGVIELRSVISAILFPIEKWVQIITYLLCAGGAIIIFILFLVVKMFIINPINQIKIGIGEIEKGNFSKKVSIQTRDELSEVGNAFNRMADGLKRLEELRNEFVFIAAHELRTPVTAIRGYVSLVLEDAETALNKEVMELLDKVRQASERLNNLVDDLLEIARSEAGRLEIKVTPIDIKDPVRVALSEVKVLADQKSIALVYDPPSVLPHIMADATRLKEVMVNVVGNAIKYTPGTGTVTISHEIHDNELVTRIQDTGIGMSGEAQKRLFEKFYRVQTEKTRNIQGTGLGLFIVKEIIEKMGGRIWVASEENRGSTFSFSLPKLKTDQ